MTSDAALPTEDHTGGPRRQKRVPFTARIVLSHPGGETEYPRTVDISMKGVFVRTVRPLPLGTAGRFALLLEAGMRRERIEGAYEVVRVVPVDDGFSDAETGAGMAVKFGAVDPESSLLLYDVVRYNQYP
ncbi:MAG: PilZ domain-containing protein [Nitrospinae bacterium]|nr:PilZ domain-containing protein [Nitrospinota bacterium]